MLVKSYKEFYKIPLWRVRRLEKIAEEVGRKHIWYSDTCDHRNCLCFDLLEAERENTQADSFVIVHGAGGTYEG